MYNILPMVKNLEEKEEYYILTSNVKIILSERLQDNSFTYAKILKKCIKENVGFELTISKGSKNEGNIFLDVDEKNSNIKEQGYELTIEKNGISLIGGDEAGLLYSVETFCQILSQSGGYIKCLTIKDYPDTPVRGYYLDQSRGRVYKMDYFKKVIDTLAKYKINQFQLYIEHTFLFEGLSEVWRNETPLTADDILELDAYCNKFHIELVPSLSTFGHLYTLLSTKSFNHFCELPDSENKEFSFQDRMDHHTVNVSDENVLPFIKGLISEYMKLFTSNKFNICADETFDLGRGKSRELANKKGIDRLYIDYVKELCEFIVTSGKIPMLWGDILCLKPNLVKELPKEVICLNWGYAVNQDDKNIKKMAETGVNQYVCPGICSWNKFIPMLRNSYENIIRMCYFAKKYKAIGVLNTDWGDCGHINQPELSVIGLIYGACFSWNSEIINSHKIKGCDDIKFDCKELSFDKINRIISKMEFHDNTKSIVNLIKKISLYSIFDWHNAIVFYESEKFGKTMYFADEETIFKLGYFDIVEILNSYKEKLMKISSHMDCSTKDIIPCIDNCIDGIIVWNRVRVMIKKIKYFESGNENFKLDCEESKKRDLDANNEIKEVSNHELAESNDVMDSGLCQTLTSNQQLQSDLNELSVMIEQWFMKFKDLWRKTSREGDLQHIAEVVFWYCDYLRTYISRQGK